MHLIERVIVFNEDTVLIADQRNEDVMQRLISFFHEPKDDAVPRPKHTQPVTVVAGGASAASAPATSAA